MRSLRKSSSELSNALSRTRDACKSALDGLLKDNIYTTAKDAAAPSWGDIRTDFLSILSLVYTHTTTLSLALKPPATPEGAIRPLSDLSSDVSKLVGCVRFIASGAHGATLHKEATWRTQEAVEAISALVDTFIDGKHLDPNDKVYLTRTGTVHSAVEQAKKSLSLDNRAAVIRTWESHGDALKDALEECGEMTNEVDSVDEGLELEDDDEDDDWEEFEGKQSKKLSPSELATTKKVYSLIRFISALHQRVSSRHLRAPRFDNPALDQLAASSDELSANVDDLVSSLYSPQNLPIVRENAEILSSNIHSLRTLLLASSPPFSSHTDVDSLTQKLDEASLDSASSLKKNAEWLVMCFDQIDKSIQSIIAESP